MLTTDQLDELTARTKRLVRERKFFITRHVLEDHPDRKITAADILECLKTGRAVALEPRRFGEVVKYLGDDRFRWLGEDHKERVLRLIIAVSEQAVVISAAKATETQASRYRKEHGSER